MIEGWHWPPRYDDGYRPPEDQPFWFPKRETLDPEQRDALIIERLRLLLDYAWDKAPFYRRKWETAGYSPGDVKTLEDFELLPVVTKEELRIEQAANPPFGDYLCTPREEIVRVWGSSGTTGRPSAFAVNACDWRAIANAHARVMWGMGIRPSDLVFIGSIFSLYIGSWGALAGAERLGSAVFPFGAGLEGQSERAIRWMEEMRPTAFYGTPSYALRLGEVAAGLGVDPRELGLRIMFFSGEPGAAIPAIRAKIEKLWDAAVFDCGSMAEATPWMNLAESSAQAGMLCWQDIVYTEVADPLTHRRVPFGGEGTPIYTHLERTTQPSIRLVSGDLTRWESGPSPCGRTYPILPRGIYGRIDDQFTVRGENIQPSAIDEVVSALLAYGGEHRIVVSRSESMDTLAIQLEYHEACVGDTAAIAAYRLEAEQALRQKLGVRTQVLPLPPGSLERTEFKARRVIDQRDLFRALADS